MPHPMRGGNRGCSPVRRPWGGDHPEWWHASGGGGGGARRVTCSAAGRVERPVGPGRARRWLSAPRPPGAAGRR
ncbi:hypothetical protein APASM_3745 [Actinosynnema pretiosum subsp. pretiosum]|nr:hypothetical protein APASM_3745 [Actinosynnema pretiosum subsp. pretiosum]